VNEPLRYPDFTEPYMRSANVLLGEAGGTNYENEIDSEDFVNESYDFVVDKMMVFETSTRDNAADLGPDTILLGDIYGRYWMRRGQTDSLPEMPVLAWDDGSVDRTAPVVHGMQEPEDFSIIGANLKRSPIIVPQNGILTCAWENPTITANNLVVRAGTFHIAASCRGQRSGKRSLLYLPVTFLISSGSSAAGPTGTQAYQDSSKNRLDEPLLLEDLRMWIDGDYGAANNVADTRFMRHMLARPLIQPGNICLSPSNDMLPLVAYGWNRQLDHSVAISDWSDDPLYLARDDGMGFKFTNYSIYKARVYVVLIGRRRPGGA